MASFRGFFGKLPARGDFVSAGLPRDFVARWDRWICGVLPGATEDWLQAPVWRFRLAAGVCGAEAATGLLFPSTDKVGRAFPLTLAWLDAGIDDAAVAAAEHLGRTAIIEAWAPETLAERLDEIPVGGGDWPLPAGSVWWRSSVDPLSLPALPDATTFATMMAGEAP